MADRVMAAVAATDEHFIVSGWVGLSFVLRALASQRLLLLLPATHDEGQTHSISCVIDDADGTVKTRPPR